MSYEGPHPFPITSGGTAVTSVTTSPTATAFAGWDTNKNFSTNSVVTGFQQQTLIGGSAALSVASAQYQHVVGSNGTLVLPDATTLPSPVGNGLTTFYYFDNDASGNLTVATNNNGGGGGTLFVAAPGTLYTVYLASNATAAGTWYFYANLPSLNLTQYDVLVGGAGQTIGNVGPGSAGQVLQSRGNAANPSYSTATYPTTTTLNSVLYSSSANAVDQVPVVIDGVMISNHAAGLPYFLPNSGTPGWILTANAGAPPSWQVAPVSGIVTLDGNSGSATGSTVTITTGASNVNGTALFTGSSATITLTASDSNGNTGWGTSALAAATTTTDNVAIGVNALAALTTVGHSSKNIAIGYGVLASYNPASTIVSSCGIGYNCLNAYTGVDGGNTALGYQVLLSLTEGYSNVCIGPSVAQNLLTGSSNILLGVSNGNSYTGSESYNILIGGNVTGTTSENNVLRIGTATGTSAYQLNAAYISGIYGISIGASTAVIINSSNQLGTAVSSARFKENIQDLDDASEFIYDLRPVKFTLKAHSEYGQQAGLIAEEVVKIAPGLVVLDAEGRPESVSYHELPILLLNEVQKLRKELAMLKGIK